MKSSMRSWRVVNFVLSPISGHLSAEKRTINQLPGRSSPVRRYRARRRGGFFPVGGQRLAVSGAATSSAREAACPAPSRSERPKPSPPPAGMQSAGCIDLAHRANILSGAGPGGHPSHLSPPLRCCLAPIVFSGGGGGGMPVKRAPYYECCCALTRRRRARRL